MKIMVIKSSIHQIIKFSGKYQQQNRQKKIRIEAKIEELLHSDGNKEKKSYHDNNIQTSGTMKRLNL
jgi:hypothetical protein